jgi:hypothetical protein
MLGAISKSEAYEPSASAPPPPVKCTALHQQAMQIAIAAKLYHQRLAWLNRAHQQPDEEILKRRLALNLERSANIRQE